MAFPWLSAITFVPLIGALILFGLPPDRPGLARRFGLFFSLLAGVLALFVWRDFTPTEPGLQFVERYEWIPTLGVQYFLGIDGLGLIMVLLSAFVVPFAMLASWRVTERVHLFFGLLLLLEGGLFGAFTALNFFHWFIFWELGLVPAYFLIKIWGGEKRVQAAGQFFVYTFAGSVALLLAFLALYLVSGTFDLMELAEKGRSGELADLLSLRLTWFENFRTKEDLVQFIFLLAFLGFAVKVPIFPFHSWLPLTYSEAPSGVTMVLTGAMSKMGVYGVLRLLLPIFPDQMRAALTPLLWLTVATIVLSAFAAFAQRDLKRMLAYSSVNHLGYCFLGLLAALQITGPEARWGLEKTAALNGVILQMFNHGLTASALFCFVAFIEQRSGGQRGLDDFGGLRKVAPVFCGLMGISLFASLGLPGLNGFVGEFLIFKGALSLVTWATAISTLGLLVSAIFLLTILQKVFSGPLNEKWAGFADLTSRERLIILPAIALMFALGIYPQALIGTVNATVMGFVEHLKF